MKWVVSGECTISISTEVRAPTKEAAIKLAEERGMISLCSSCYAGSPEEEWVTAGQLDGEPFGLRAEELEDGSE